MNNDPRFTTHVPRTTGCPSHPSAFPSAFLLGF